MCANLRGAIKTLNNLISWLGPAKINTMTFTDISVSVVRFFFWTGVVHDELNFARVVKAAATSADCRVTSASFSSDR